MRDIVIDTNVLMHADNVSSRRDAESLRLLCSVLASTTQLCVDARHSGTGFDADASLIMQEYIDRLNGAGTGVHFIAQMASEGRISYLSREVEQRVTRWINQRIGNTRDRTFLRVAKNSEEKVLVSHDFKDFGRAMRRAISNELDLAVVDASEAEAMVDGGTVLD